MLDFARQNCAYEAAHVLMQYTPVLIEVPDSFLA